MHAIYINHAEKTADCRYRCLAGLIAPNCLDPLTWYGFARFLFCKLVCWLWGLFLLCRLLKSSDHILVVSMFMGGPILLLWLLRSLLVVAIKRPTLEVGSSGNGDLSSPFSTSAEQTLYSSFDQPAEDSTCSQRVAARLRYSLGWAAGGSEPGARWISGDEAQSSTVKRADLPYLFSRVYLSGNNSPWSPWRLSPEPPQMPDETDSGAIDLESYKLQAAQLTETVAWTKLETLIYVCLAIVCYPIAQSWKSRTRAAHYELLREFVVKKVRHSNVFLDKKHARTSQWKVGGSCDGTLAYLDLLAFVQQQTSEQDRSRPRLPMLIYFAGDGSYAQPLCLDVSDALVKELCRLASPNFASEMNEIVATLGPGVTTSLDTSLTVGALPAR
eukprot:COSAG05_NODE_1266_length_5332_cov_5.080833_4_plen_386_part_00